jgi:hypothetical protein
MHFSLRIFAALGFTANILLRFKSTYV